MNDLPNIKFVISSNGLGKLEADIQKVPGFVMTGVTVANKVTVGTSYPIYSLQAAVNLGITETGTNAFAYNHIKAFYDQAKTGAELWIMLVASTVTYQDMADKTKAYAKKLLTDAKGKIRILGLLKKSANNETITFGLDADVALGIVAAQDLADTFSDKYYPMRVLISGNKFSGIVADLKDYTTTTYNRVACLIANNDGSKEASIGLALGRLASIPVQRKISRVKNGAIEPFNAYFTNGLPIETLDDSLEAIHKKGYIFMRSFSNRSGYYFTGDATLTGATDDFNSLARGLVMDKAVLLTYNVLVEELSDEVPALPNGNIHPAIIKSWQNSIEKNIKGLMVDTKELSGVKAFIDPNQKVVNDEFNVLLDLLPVGYSDYITVNIGFTTTLE